MRLLTTDSPGHSGAVQVHSGGNFCDSDLFDQIGGNSYFDGVGNIGENAHQLVPICLTGILPNSVNHLRFGRNAMKALLKFEEGVADQFVRYRLAVIEAQRQQDFEAPLRAAHRSRALLPERECSGAQERQQAPSSHRWTSSEMKNARPKTPGLGVCLRHQESE